MKLDFKKLLIPRLPVRKRLAHGELVADLMLGTLETYRGSFELTDEKLYYFAALILTSPEYLNSPDFNQALFTTDQLRTLFIAFGLIPEREEEEPEE